MMWVDYYVRDSYVSNHETIVEGTQVSCNYIDCNYTERFDAVDDAEIAAEIHGELER